jgi:hypothetical protein
MSFKTFQWGIFVLYAGTLAVSFASEDYEKAICALTIMILILTLTYERYKN